jgi:Ser/Thr protein kinase RdoA (MazF antagonist)
MYSCDLASVMQPSTTVAAVLGEYPADCQPSAIVFLGGAGGFSGAEFWRLETRRGQLCLRRWPPEHPSRERLAWIHSVVQCVSMRGFPHFADPIRTDKGASFVERDGYLWELARWLPGRADYHERPNRKKLQGALTTVAQFHLRAPPIASHGSDTRFHSPAIFERLARVECLVGGQLDDLRSAILRSSNVDQGLGERSLNILSRVEPRLPELQKSLQASASIEVKLQLCLRDIWHDHVLFVGDAVSGIVDLGAMRVETVAADVARLVGSLCGADQEAWRAAIEAYDTVRPLTDDERRLIPILHRSQTLLAGINWIEWVYIEQRRFADPAAVERRITDIHERLIASINADD